MSILGPSSKTDPDEFWNAVLAGFRSRSVRHLFLKRLAHNDNEKNQIYLGPSLDGLAGALCARMTPGSSSESTEKRGSTSGKPKSVAHLDWVWIGDGPDAQAPATKLIHYFQYPEVRLSGFLTDCRRPPDALRRRRLDEYGDRLLLFGSNGSTTFGTVIAAPAGEPLPDPPGAGPSSLTDCLLEIHLDKPRDTERMVLDLLDTWHPTMRLPRAGEPTIPFHGPQAAGYTLEALLGIPTNATKGPDHLGSELKTFKFGNRVTLMTPSADGGEERRLGARSFLQRHGHPGRDGTSIRFTGTYRTTGITKGRRLILAGRTDHVLTTRSIDLTTVSDQKVLARWSAAHIGDSWLKKHDSAFYLQYTRDRERNLVRYLGFFRCRRTSPERLFNAIDVGTVFYDPAHTLKVNSLKVRPQWRISSSRKSMPETLRALYRDICWVEP